MGKVRTKEWKRLGSSNSEYKPEGKSLFEIPVSQKRMEKVMGEGHCETSVSFYHQLFFFSSISMKWSKHKTKRACRLCWDNKKTELRERVVLLQSQLLISGRILRQESRLRLWDLVQEKKREQYRSKMSLKAYFWGLRAYLWINH